MSGAGGHSQNVGLLMEEGAESPHAEAYRVLRTNILFSRKDDKLNTIAVVSAGAGEGKSTTVFKPRIRLCPERAANLDRGLRPAPPTLHKMLRVTNTVGLTNYLLRQNALEEVIQTTSLPTLDFLASGKLPSSFVGHLSSAQNEGPDRRVEAALTISSSSIHRRSWASADASILASEVDMTLQVIQLPPLSASR